MRKTKIIATVGPACNSFSKLKEIVLAGANILRINLSHATTEFMETILHQAKRLRQELNLPLPIMLDTRGPELRIKTFKDGNTEIEKGQTFIFTARKIIGNNREVSINLQKFVKAVKVGDVILANNGLMRFKVVEVEGQDIVTKAENSGILVDRKSLYVPGVAVKTPYLNEADKRDILWGIKNDIELLALSFVNTKENVISVKKFLANNGGDMKVISKIESQLGVENMDDIIDASDGIMVARGDLGVEVPLERLPDLQKLIIKQSRLAGKPVVTATEMLESMIHSPRPTRAEVSDVANAVYDGTSCVMLSAETASGDYPAQAVLSMANIALEAERHLEHINYFDSDKIGSIPDIVSQCAVGATYMSDIKVIVAFTSTGRSAGLISRFLPKVDILGVTPNPRVYRQLELYWGVKPIMTALYNSTDKMLEIGNDLAKKLKYAKRNETILVTCGTPQVNGGTNMLKIIQVE